ncbi:hypothetical protein HT031_001219 [Scenedesmus sp. PABB004]|nr:hypothetical protein HT031_001219 [Scenedesmus sp. PABB004]
MPAARRGQRRAALLLLAMLGLAQPGLAGGLAGGGRCCRRVRFATFNTSLNRDRAGALLAELARGESAQAANVSHMLQIIRPDVLLLNEFDFEPSGAAVDAFLENFLAVPQAPGLRALRYEHTFIAPVNTGVPSGRDWDHDGRSEGPEDCFGFGRHPGQYGMVLLSRFPIDAAAARTFQHFLWRDMPGAALPTDPATGQPWYDEDDLAVFRLSSKSHWDLPIDVPCGPPRGGGGGGGGAPTARMHMLLHHPTPPAFDGPERRNARRNHDEIRLFSDYIGCGAGGAGAGAGAASYIYDDAGARGGLPAGASFVIMGDHNADPRDGASHRHAIRQLLDCPAVSAGFTPTSPGGREAGNRRRGDRTPPETKTSDFDLRVDYVLPSADLRVLGGAVFWPVRADPRARLLSASDHRPVHLDVLVCAGAGGGADGAGGGADGQGGGARAARDAGAAALLEDEYEEVEYDEEDEAEMVDDEEETDPDFTPGDAEADEDEDEDVSLEEEEGLDGLSDTNAPYADAGAVGGGGKRGGLGNPLKLLGNLRPKRLAAAVTGQRERLQRLLWRLEDASVFTAKFAARALIKGARPALVWLVVARALRTIDRSEDLGLRMMRQPAHKQMDYYYSHLLGDDWEQQLEQDFVDAVAEVDEGYITDDMVRERRGLQATILRRLEVEEWDKERMRHFYYGLYGLGPWYWDMEERLHNPFFIGARAWNGPAESWIGENQARPGPGPAAAARGRRAGGAPAGPPHRPTPPAPRAPPAQVFPGDMEPASRDARLAVAQRLEDARGRPLSRGALNRLLASERVRGADQVLAGRLLQGAGDPVQVKLRIEQQREEREQQQRQREQQQQVAA